MTLPENYVRPSMCALCVAVPSYQVSGAMGVETVTYAHQDECRNNLRNHPRKGNA